MFSSKNWELYIFSLLFLWSSKGSDPYTPPSSCPIQFQYVHDIPWNQASCLNLNHSTLYSTPGYDNCCTTLNSLFTLGLSYYVNATSLFKFLMQETDMTCLNEFESEMLSFYEIPHNFFSSCLDPQRFLVITSQQSLCHQMVSISDWLTELGDSKELISVQVECSRNLAVNYYCGTCTAAKDKLVSHLVGGFPDDIDDCTMLANLYIAGNLNDINKNKGLVSCVFGLLPSNLEPICPKGFHPLLAGLLGAMVALLVVLFIIVLRLYC